VAMRGVLFRILQIDLALALIALLEAIGYLAVTPTALTQVVDLVRGVVGPVPVAFAENTFYGLTDAVQRTTFQGRTTPGYWTAPPTSVPRAPAAVGHIANPPTPAPAASGRTANAPTPAPAKESFQPANVTPPYPNLAVPGEGVWVPIPNTLDAAAPLLMYKTFLHADPERPYSRVAIVAMDATRLRLHAVAGTVDPVSTARVLRSGLVSPSDVASLVAAFNGGFKAIHGHYGMLVNGQTILPPQPNADTIALYRDGSVRIAPWSVISNTLPLMQSYRQTPEFLAYQGHVNPNLSDNRFPLWGAAVGGNTVIWRSALGISADGQTLYYAVGESLTAQRLAEALVDAGASNVAELDVNAWHEQFLTFAADGGKLTGQVLIDGMSGPPGLFVSTPSSRDFFYLTLAR
jgi:Phosphodiester glycosidase